MAGLDAQPADSSPAPVVSRSLDSLSESEMATWRMTGDLPAPSEPTTPSAESSPAEPADQVASTDALTQPASEPGKPSIKNTAETRKAELAREIEEILARRNQLLEENRQLERRQPAPGTDAKPAESSPAPAQTLAQTVTRPDIAKPALNDTEFFAQFPDATLADFTDYRSNYLYERRSVESRQSSERKTRHDACQAKIQEAENASPGWWEKLDPRVKTLPTRDHAQPGEPITPLHDVGQHVLTSSVAPKLLTYFSEHPAELARLANLTHPIDVARELGKLEAKLDTTAPPIKAVSSAPAPPSTLGSKPATAQTDDADDALSKGDVERYIAVMNRREMASAR